MEEEKIEEQLPNLETETTSVDNSSTAKVVLPDVDGTNAEKGEPVGRFKSAADLLEAYNNLEGEFTRKSQRLAELERQKKPDEQTENGLKAFLSKRSEAFAYADELKKRVAQEKSQDEESFEKVWADMLFEKLSSTDSFQNLILNDDKVKDLVIKNYVESLQKQQKPIVMSSGSGGRVTKPVTPKPDTFEQAKSVVLGMLDR